MTSPSNLYAEKAFSEHPIALWALDDQADYVSPNIYDYMTIKYGTSGTLEQLPSTQETSISRPLDQERLYKITGSTSSDKAEIQAGGNWFQLSDFNQDRKTFSIGAYVYSASQYITGYEIGYKQIDTAPGGTITEHTKYFSTTVSGNWIYISETFEIPESNSTLGIIPIIKINYNLLGSTESDYIFYINGLSMAQWSEEFSAISMGVIPQLIPDTISIDETYGVEAKAYGLSEDSGYYLSDGSVLFARNSSIPLVYGASGTTVLYPNGTNPSIILPGKGFLNHSGQYRTYSVEMWLRLDARTTTAKRIFGPIASTDGIYVDGANLILKIGDSIGSHFVGEWFRPMLLHIRVSKNSANLLVNGEHAISINFVTSDLNLPLEYDGSGKSQDWLGFYAYDDVTPYEIDCFSIYPYQIPAVLAKRKWVYGQGVEFPENINAAYSGTSIYIDYPFSNYTNNYNYPSIGPWKQGILENIAVKENCLVSPQYSLPEVIFSNKTRSEWDSDIADAQSSDSPFISLSPNSAWNDTDGYMLFEQLNLVSGGTKAFYGIFKETGTVVEKQILMYIEDTVTQNYLEVLFDGESIEYNLKYGSKYTNLYTAIRDPATAPFTVGINIQKMSDYFGGDVASFFGKVSSLSLFIGGNKTLQNTYRGNIYSVGFCTERNLEKVAHLFDVRGVNLSYEDVFNLYGTSVDFSGSSDYFGNQESYFDEVLDGGAVTSFMFDVQSLALHTASYTLIPKQYIGTFSMDIMTDSYWEDYIPLSYFAQYVTDSNGDKYYDLDFIQLNIDYPALNIFSGNTYNTSSSPIRTYVTFQYSSNGANASRNFFSSEESVPADGIIQPGSNWMKTRYEVVDNAIIYPPSGVNFNDLVIAVHIEAKVPGIIANPFRIKTLQLASQSFNESSPNVIGTRFGSKLYPYTKSGVYFNYKDRNPFSIYKSSSPYLYLTKKSGIQLRGPHGTIDRGISIPINQTLAANYKVIAMQMALLYSQESFPTSATPIFEIQSNGSYIKFYIESLDSSGTRARIYAMDAITGTIDGGIGFYLNGKIVREPVLTINEWSILGINFPSPQNFNSTMGAIRITSDILVNNLSYYQSTSLQEAQQIRARSWSKVKYENDGITTRQWDDWVSTTWNGVLVVSTTSYYGLNPSDIYKTYTGTNKIIVDDSKKFRLKSYEYSLYKDVSWSTNTLVAV